MSNIVLVHHGIKGQKHGVRNGPPYPLSDSDMSSAEKKNLTKDSKKEMTNDELRKANERMRLENEYDRQLSEWLSRNSDAVDKGKSFAKKLMDSTSTMANIVTNTSKILSGLSSIDKLLGLNKFPHYDNNDNKKANDEGKKNKK